MERRLDARTGSLLAVAAGWVGLIWLWDPAYLALTVDDAFYYLQIARNLAAGRGFTFGGLEPTNGFHPLWLGLLALLVRLLPDDPALLMRAALTLQVILVGAGVGLVRLALGLPARALAVAAALALGHFYLTKSLVNGMESALLFLLMAGALALWASPAALRRWAAARPLGLGLLGSLATLARFEAALFALPIVLSPRLFDRHPDRGRSGRDRLLAAAAWLLPVAGWLLWSRARFGHPTPVSAAIKAEIGLSDPRWSALAPALLGLALAVPLGRRLLAAAPAPVRRGALVLAPVLAYGLAVSLLHLTLGGGAPPIWYLVPHALLLIAAGAGLAATGGRRRRRVALAVALVWLAGAAAAWRVRLDPRSYAPYLAARASGRWLRDHAPPEALAAGWACGIAAAHAERRFLNLDGLASSWRYKRDYLFRGRTQEFIDRVHRVDHIVQYFDRELLPEIASRSFRGVEIAGWSVARAECVEARAILHPGRIRPLVYTVLQRAGDPSLPRFDRWAREEEGICGDRGSPRPQTPK